MGRPQLGEAAGRGAPALSRRAFLRTLLAGGAGLLAACARRTLPTPAPTSTVPASPTFVPTAAPVPEPTAVPTPTVAPTIGATQRPADRIENVVIFIQENHTFDSLFADFPGADGVPADQRCPDALRRDPPHQHVDAFEPQAARTTEARCSYAEADAPNYWKIARAFTLCDRFFSEVRGPSHPNYLMLTAAQSPIVNTPPHDECPEFCLDLPTLADRLDAQGLTWRDYGGILTDIRSLAGRPEVYDQQDAPFFEDAAAGRLPNVCWLNSSFVDDGLAKSGHPPASLCAAEGYAVRVLNALMNGPQWGRLAIFLVWDDWGGFYDHVDPPVVETWSDGTPFRYGFRVPCLVIGPYARPGYVAHDLYSHVSVLRFVETVFELAPLTERDAQAGDMLGCFDFSQAPLPPLTLTPRECP